MPLASTFPLVDIDPVVDEFFLRSVLVFAAANNLNDVYLSRSYEAIDLRATRVFDYYPFQGGPIYSLLPIVEKRIEDRVYIFNEKGVYRTSLDYSSYLEAVRLTRDSYIGGMNWRRCAKVSISSPARSPTTTIPICADVSR
jgi:hypothetical protein